MGGGASMMSGIRKRRPKAADPVCWINKTEERGITVSQLRDVYRFIEEGCSSWIEDFRESPDYGKALVAREVNLYQTVNNVIKPRTKPLKCSYVELVAEGPQVPKWFVSHWWGEPVLAFLVCLQNHVKLRHLDIMHSAYWVCAYANNQWRLDDAISADPKQTSFYKALQLCVGTISIVDKDATTFSRIWCCFEVTMTLRSTDLKLLYDVAVALPESCDGEAAILTDGLTPEDKQEGKKQHWEHRGGAYGHKLEREKCFPADVFSKAWRVKLEEGQASRDEDRVRILNSIAQKEEQYLNDEPEQHSQHYDDANRHLTWRLGVAYLQVAAGAKSDSAVSVEEILAHPEPIFEETQSGEGPVVETYLGMFQAFKARAEYALALAMLEKLLPIQTEALGDTHPDVAGTMNNMGVVCDDQSKYELALQHYEKALRIRKAALGETHPKVGDTLNNMALVYNKQSEYELALQHYEKALQIRKAALGETHPQVGATLNNMAMVYRALSKYELALQHYDKALQIQKTALGEGHPDLGMTLNNMAVVYDNQSKYELALQHYEKALQIRKVAFGETHPAVADTLNNMALVYDNLSKHELALQHYEKALEIRKAALGETHPDVGDTLYNMAMLFQAQSKVRSSVEMYRKAAAVYGASYGASHSETVDALQQADVLEASILR